MTFALWVSFAVISAANIITPGPAILNTVRRATQVGFKRVIPTILGNATGLAVAGVACASGVATFVLTSDLLWMVFRWLGVAYLAWLGLNLIVKQEKIDINSAPATSQQGLALFVEAFALAVTNPKAILFYLSLFPQVIIVESHVEAQITLLVLTYCILSCASLTGYSLLANALRHRFLTQNRYNTFRFISGIILLCFAASLAIFTG